ncbi:uncharacterized protein LOC131157709 isoform X2 [Malania oleifera]|nr:uncharacterized protein LOC131157709 isoform X2 [Malania oleifera]XP_057968028.1 uncharacterized protein LOC131157709 isoform X2 [Malania oleifera]
MQSQRWPAEQSKDPTTPSTSSETENASALLRASRRKTNIEHSKSSGIENPSAAHQVLQMKTKKKPSKTSGMENPSALPKASQRKTMKRPSKSNGMEKPSALPQASQINIKTKPSSGPSKPPKCVAPEIHYVRWNGINKTGQAVGHKCYLCDWDVACAPEGHDHDHHQNCDHEFESILPEVSVLPCGHIFHSNCLQAATPREQSRDPPCYFCISCNS